MTEPLTRWPQKIPMTTGPATEDGMSLMSFTLALLYLCHSALAPPHRGELAKMLCFLSQR